MSNLWFHCYPLEGGILSKWGFENLFVFLRRWSQWTSCFSVWTQPKTESCGWEIIKLEKSDQWTWKSELGISGATSTCSNLESAWSSCDSWQSEGWLASQFLLRLKVTVSRELTWAMNDDARFQFVWPDITGVFGNCISSGGYKRIFSTCKWWKASCCAAV